MHAHNRHLKEGTRQRVPSFFAARRDYCVADIYLESPDGSRRLDVERMLTAGRMLRGDLFQSWETLCGVS